jgi:crossover junction endodeoxyribonuclease RuvC
VVIGIDVGKNGAVAWTTLGETLVEKMPDTIRDLWDLIYGIAVDARSNMEIPHCYLEQVSSSPQMGVVSAFSFGNGFGHLEMALTASCIPYTKVRPQVWMKHLGCMTKGDKNVTKRMAQQLYPGIKITHTNADALLIHEYGKQIEK